MFVLSRFPTCGLFWNAFLVASSNLLNAFSIFLGALSNCKFSSLIYSFGLYVLF